MVGVSNGVLPVKYFCYNKASFWCKSNFMENIRLLQRWVKIWPPSVLGILPYLRQTFSDMSYLIICAVFTTTYVFPTLSGARIPVFLSRLSWVQQLVVLPPPSCYPSPSSRHVLRWGSLGGWMITTGVMVTWFTLTL